MGGRVAASIRIHLRSAGRREGAGFSTARVSSTAPASAAISASAHVGPSFAEPFLDNSSPLRRPVVPILTALAFQSSAMPRLVSDRVIETRPVRRRAEAVPETDSRPWAAPEIGPHPASRSGDRAARRARALGPSVGGACAYRRFQLRLRIIIAVQGRGTCAVDRISSRRTLGVVVELMQRATCFTHGRPPPLGRSRVLTCHTRGEQWPCHARGPTGHWNRLICPRYSVSRQAGGRDGRHLRPREWRPPGRRPDRDVRPVAVAGAGPVELVGRPRHAGEVSAGAQLDFPAERRRASLWRMISIMSSAGRISDWPTTPGGDGPTSPGMAFSRVGPGLRGRPGPASGARHEAWWPERWRSPVAPTRRRGSRSGLPP